MAFDTEERDPRDINESADIPDGGFIQSEGGASNKFCLSNYDPIPTNFGISPHMSSILTLNDCHFAMRDVLHKARLLIFEIARQNRPFHRRHLKKITLTGSIRDLDVMLSSSSNNLSRLLDLQHYVQTKGRMGRLLRSSLVANESFKDSSSSYYSYHSFQASTKALIFAAAILKRSFLRSEKAFVQDVLQILKRAVINRDTPDFSGLTLEAKKCSSQIERVTSGESPLWRHAPRSKVSRHTHRVHVT